MSAQVRSNAFSPSVTFGVPLMTPSMGPAAGEPQAYRWLGVAFSGVS